MSELISGIDVPRLIKKDVSIQYRTVSNGGFKEGQWNDFILDELEEKFTIGDLINAGRWDFRLKPRTITLNGIEIPAPFEPKYGDEVFVLDTENDESFHGFVFHENSGNHRNYIKLGAWRTEDEIKQVVEALRSIFK